MDKNLPSGENRVVRDPMDEFIDRSLEGLDSILDGCLDSIASGGKTDKMIDDSLSFLNDVTSRLQDNDQHQQEDVVSTADVSNQESWVVAPSNRLTDDRHNQIDGNAGCPPKG
jgi:hypothetical protein